MKTGFFRSQWLGVALLLALAGCGQLDATVGGAPDDQLGAGSHALSSIPMGATVRSGGASFRVWAPAADGVDVVGDFGSQSLSAVGDGTFAADLDGPFAGQTYHYEVSSGGRRLVRADPRALQIANDPGRVMPDSVLYDQSAYAWSSSFTTPPANHQVIYEMHVGTFADTNGPGPGTGTYASALGQLDYLAQLGVNMIELLPVNEFPGSFGWGYNPTYPMAAASAYGSPDELKALVDGAHARGIGVILDVVHNHYFQDDNSAPSLSMFCFDGSCGNNGGAWFYSEGTPWGPRPAYGTRQVHDFIVDDLVMWTRDFHVDGFRWDSSIYTRRTDWNVSNGHDIPEAARLLKDVNLAVHAQNPNAITIAEDLAGWDAITNPVDRSAINTYSSGFGFDSQWDDGFFYTLKNLMVEPNDANRDMNALAGALRTYYGGKAMHRVIYTEDHDKVAPQNGSDKLRIPEAIWPGHAGSYWAKKRSTLGAAVELTAPGIPMLFMGQEFLENTPFPFSQAGALDWSKTGKNAGVLQLYRDLIALRENRFGNSKGLTGNSLNVFHVNNGAKVVGYHRWDRGGAGDDVIVVVNFSNTAFPSYTLGFPRGGTWHVRLNSDWNGYSADFANTPSNDTNAWNEPMDGLNYRGNIGIGPYSVVILSQ